ncbi:MAG TPA: hypothetical protein VFI65_05140 [Streptosporangiaceae bacterium]|nr:hypothetical protein [Streptosporangiaceae bacterium]
MTRIPRVIPVLQDQASKLPGYAGNLRERVSGKSLAYVGAGLALAGTGAAAAAGGFAGSPAGPVSQANSINRATAPLAASQHPGKHAAAGHALSQHADTAKHSKPVVHGSAKPKHDDAKHSDAKHSDAKHSSAGHGAANHGAANHKSEHASTHQRSAHRMTFRWSRGDGRPQAWDAIERVAAGQPASHSSHGPLPAQDRLTPVGTSGPQSWMAMTPERYDNAKTIVRQVIAKKMGLRSAVIAVATAMQESTLLNVNYGDSDSLGLFQQRPSCGWGTAAQILHPSYAADAFLGALRSYQDRDPSWSQQPLWQTAQGVQASGFPTAYAKWEAQAAGLVHSIARQLV